MEVRPAAKPRARKRPRTPGVYLRGAEAVSYLTLASLALRLLPFKRLVPFFTRPLRRPALTGEERSRAIADVRRAVLAAAVRLPNRPVCLPQAIAAQAMLRRRSVATTMHYGAHTGGGTGLKAHAWLLAGDEGVVGQEIADQYPILATFTNAGAPTDARLVVEQ